MRFTQLTLATLGTILSIAAPQMAFADELRNIKPGEPVPAFKLATIEDSVFDSAACKGSVLVVVYLSAEQRSSELAAADSLAVMSEFKGEPVKLVHVTADAIKKAYFQKFRSEHKVDVPLGFDADRGLYHQLGMIVFPTTLVMDKEGNLVHVISLRGPDYTKTLDVYVKHALGTLTADQVQEKLKTSNATESSPRNLASAHRSAARLMRDKGRLEAARDELLKARSLDPSDHEVQVDLADIHLAMNDLDSADSVIDQLLHDQPEHRRAKQLKGICLFKRGKLQEAESVLLDALKLNPDPGRVHYYLGRIYEQQGQTQKALEHYREALRKAFNEPADPAAP